MKRVSIKTGGYPSYKGVGYITVLISDSHKKTNSRTNVRLYFNTFLSFVNAIIIKIKSLLNYSNILSDMLSFMKSDPFSKNSSNEYLLL